MGKGAGNSCSRSQVSMSAGAALGAGSAGARPLEPTADALRQARQLLETGWRERARKLGRQEPADLAGACQLASLFARELFGGEIRGNWYHQWLEHPQAGRIDLTGAPEYAQGIPAELRARCPADLRVGDVYQHDPRFWSPGLLAQQERDSGWRAQEWAQRFRAR